MIFFKEMNQPCMEIGWPKYWDVDMIYGDRILDQNHGNLMSFLVKIGRLGPVTGIPSASSFTCCN